MWLRTWGGLTIKLVMPTRFHYVWCSKIKCLKGNQFQQAELNLPSPGIPSDTDFWCCSPTELVPHYAADWDSSPEFLQFFRHDRVHLAGHRASWHTHLNTCKSTVCSGTDRGLYINMCLTTCVALYSPKDKPLTVLRHVAVEFTRSLYTWISRR